MSERSYHQHCGLARSLDLLGERWTLLVVRELDRGPKRFTDLDAELGGLGRNLLAARLKRLEAAGVIERVSLAPGVPAYGLTARGEGLSVALEELALWGLGQMGAPDGDVETRAAWAAQSVRARLDRDERPPLGGTYAFLVGDEAFWLQVRAEGRSLLRDGAPPFPADATLAVTKESFFGLLFGGASLDDVGAEVTGDERLMRELLERCRTPLGAASV